MLLGLSRHLRIDKEENRLVLGKGELGARLLRRIQNAADRADEDYIHLFDERRLRSVGMVVIRVIVVAVFVPLGVMVGMIMISHIVISVVFLSGMLFGGVIVIFGGVILDAIAVVVMVVVSGGLLAEHHLAQFQNRLGAVRFLLQQQGGAVLRHLGGGHLWLLTASAGGKEPGADQSGDGELETKHENLGNMGGMAANRVHNGAFLGRTGRAGRYARRRQSVRRPIVGFFCSAAKITLGRAKSMVAGIRPAKPRRRGLQSTHVRPNRRFGPFSEVISMIKKLILTTLGVGMVGGVLTASNLGSYITTSARQVTSSVEESVPMTFQIDRARNMVRDLEPEIRRSMHTIAKEEVEVAELDKRLQTAIAKADKDKSEIMRLQSDLKSGKNVFRYAGHSYSEGEVKEDLARRFNRFKTVDGTIESMQQMRDARQRNLDAAREKLTAMMSAQRQLQVDVENLEAKLKLVEVAEASSDFQFDDSKLARAKQLMTDIRTRLDVAAKLANADVNFQKEIPLDETVAEDVTEQVAEYFGLEAKGETKIATASFAE